MELFPPDDVFKQACCSVFYSLKVWWVVGRHNKSCWPQRIQISLTQEYPVICSRCWKSKVLYSLRKEYKHIMCITLTHKRWMSETCTNTVSALRLLLDKTYSCLCTETLCVCDVYEPNEKFTFQALHLNLIMNLEIFSMSLHCTFSAKSILPLKMFNQAIEQNRKSGDRLSWSTSLRSL